MGMKKELSVIQTILKEINDSRSNAATNGNSRKRVGVITFYAQQARRLETLCLDNADRYPNLDLRVGTVDRFQGIEREIVIVSMVCNNQKGRIGFARQPERINVALSRAQELLILVGCARLFIERTHSSDASHIYNNVAEIIRKEGELLDVHRFISN